MKYATLDIETDANGQPTDFGYYDGENLFITTSITQFIKVVWESGINTFYAHAGMRFDYCILYPYLLKLGDLQISVAGTQGISITIIKGRKQVRLLDSFRLLPTSLANLSKQFDVVTKKQQLNQMPWELTQEARQDYLKDDCIALYQVVEKFWSLIDAYTEGATIRAVTLPALALKIFQQNYLPKFLSTTKTRNKKINTSSGKLLDFEQASYFGGCVWAAPDYAGSEQSIICYDVNSMYPYCMLHNYPYSYVGAWTTKFKPKSIGLWKVVFTEHSREAQPFIFDVNTRSLSYSGEAILDTRTVEYLLSTGASVAVVKGYVYEQTGTVFSDFVNDFYNMRLQFGSQSALGFTAKILLNSLYGKFGEKPIKRALSTISPGDREDVQIHAVRGHDGEWIEMYDYEVKVFIKHRFPAIASFITLAARLELREAADKVVKLGGTVIYCDTDSLHVLDMNRDYFVDTTELGGMKLEFRGTGIYLGKKIYQWYNEAGEPCKTVAKGIPKKASNFDFRSINSGRKVAFDSFSTLFDIIKGDIFSLKSKHRTLRRTV